MIFVFNLLCVFSEEKEMLLESFHPNGIVSHNVDHMDYKQTYNKFSKSKC